MLLHASQNQRQYFIFQAPEKWELETGWTQSPDKFLYHSAVSE